MLGALSRPLTPSEHQLFLNGVLRVPDADLALFATGFLPRLRRRLTVQVDPTLDLPEVLPPARLPRPVRRPARRAHLGFRYTVGAETHDLPAAPAATENPIRDVGSEAALAASVPEGPWRTGTELHETSLIGRGLITFTGEVLPGLRARDDVVVETEGDEPTFTEAEDAPRVELRVTESAVGTGSTWASRCGWATSWCRSWSCSGLWPAARIT